MTLGIIGKKLGMTQLFSDNGQANAVTAIEAGPCIVTQIKTKDKEGYNSVQMGFGQAKTAAQAAPAKGLKRFKHLREFRVDATEAVNIGDKIDVSLFQAGDLVDITGVSKGKGFAGVVKRHHFHGGPKTHGQSDRHRHAGSIGASTSPGRVLKGTRMAGHMGHRQTTVRHLEVFETNPERNLLVVRGAVPGSRNGLLIIKKTGGGK